MAVAGRRQGAGRQRPRPPPTSTWSSSRPARWRRRSPTPSRRVAAPARHRRARRVRPQRRLLRLLLRAGQPPTTRSAPARPRTCSSSARRSSPQWIDWTDRSTAHHLRRRRGRRGGRPVRRRPASARSSGAAPATSPTRSCIEDRDGSLHQEGQTVFRWATTALHPVAKEACERAGVDPSRARRLRPAPGQPAHHRGDRAQARRRQRRRRQRHRRRPATPPPRPSRSRCRACSSAARSVRAALALLLGFGAGLTYAGQVIEIP